MIGTETRKSLASFDIASGALTSFNIECPSGSINNIVISGSTLYVGGEFDIIGGQNIKSFAAINIDNNTLITSFNPDLQYSSGSPTIECLYLYNNTLYISGSFNKIFGKDRSYFATLNTSNNTLSDFTINMESNICTMIRDGNTLLLGGRFMNINNKFHPCIVSVDTSGNIRE
ncbi:MAG TPA: hypothetical protein PLE45_04460 [Spirochaetota bacterium]|nr:hypothetical protein [Spirochaetota bacterium]HOL57283.1 hypothetical protein [Spirochaetota bacterium]HPP04833.1 hypothetical protein [Spirochaetota bacterium]